MGFGVSRELPGGGGVFAESVRSVARRGFYDVAPVVVGDVRIMAEFLRLVEEIGEFGLEAAMGEAANLDSLADEAADIIIVSSNLFWLAGGDIDGFLPDGEANAPGGLAEVARDLPVMVGMLARSLRDTSAGYAPARERLGRIMGTAWHFMAGVNGSPSERVREKLQRDERRGRLHQGGNLTM